MIQVSILANFIDSFVFILGIIIFNHFIDLDNHFQKINIVKDALIITINSTLGLFLEDFNLIIWFIASLICQKLKTKKLNYYFLNNRLASIIICLTISTTIICIESFTKWILRKIYDIKYSNDITIYIRSILYLFLIILLINWIKNHNNRLDYIDNKIDKLKLNKRIFSILLFLFISIITILVVSQLANITNTIKFPMLIIFVIFVALTFIQVFSFIQSYSYRQEAEAKIVQNQQLQEYLQNMEQQYQELRHFKHDYQNMLLALEGFAKNNNQQEFKDYYQQLVQQQPHTENLERLTISHIDHLKNEPLRGLIVQKFFVAKQDNIQLQLEISQDIKIHNTDILSIVRILGILLDNAIEQTTKENEKTVQCALNYIDNKVIEITIANPATNLTNIDQLFTNGYTTKKGHHGFGLTNVQKLVKQNKNLFLETELLKQHLTITIMITGEE